jgi:hypothetical protein
MRTRRGGALLGIVWLSVAGMPACARAAASTEPVKCNLKIDSQALANALQEFARQCDLQIIFFSRVAEGLRAPALDGRYTIAAALSALLAGSRLTFRVINPKTVEIRLPEATNQRDGADGRSTETYRDDLV